jgi:hypothetical protein
MKKSSSFKTAEGGQFDRSLHLAPRNADSLVDNPKVF